MQISFKRLPFFVLGLVVFHENLFHQIGSTKGFVDGGKHHYGSWECHYDTSQVELATIQPNQIQCHKMARILAICLAYKWHNTFKWKYMW